MHSQMIGRLGELKIKQKLLEQNHNIYTPEVDIFGTDLVVELSYGAFKRVQVKKQLQNQPQTQLFKFAALSMWT